MNQSLVFSVFWKEDELQRLIGTPCQWLVLLNVLCIRASNEAVHQLKRKSNISFSLHFQSFNVYGSPYFLSKPIIMPLLWCLCLNCTELRTFLCLLREGWNYAGSKTWHCQEWLEHLFSSNCACLSIWRLYLEDNSGDWQCSCSQGHKMKPYKST